uniref:Uncharacterized protein n=1 Tax=Macaca mulatta TaxID=9544 RepID=A0A5F7ZCU5_MACMU
MTRSLGVGTVVSEPGRRGDPPPWRRLVLDAQTLSPGTSLGALCLLTHLNPCNQPMQEVIFLLLFCRKEQGRGRALWLTPVIPALWEAKAGGSPEVRSSRPAWPTWWNSISTKNTKISRAWWHMAVEIRARKPASLQLRGAQLPAQPICPCGGRRDCPAPQLALAGKPVWGWDVEIERLVG